MQPGNLQQFWQRWWANAHVRRVGSVLLVALSVRALVLGAGVVPFNADEAVVALMARHILAGAHPIFFYGQAYMGSLDAWLIAGGFALLGQQVWVIRLVQTLLFCGTLITTYALAWRIYRNQWVASAATLLLAVPPVLLTLYTTITLGGYGETLLIGNGLLLLALHLAATPTAHPLSWALFGLLGGVGFWTFPLVGVYLLPASLYLGLTYWRTGRGAWARLGLVLLGLLVGALPWWVYTLQNGAATLTETSGAAIAGQWHPVFSIFSHTFNFLLFGLTVLSGLRPPWNARFLGLPLIPYTLILYSAMFGSIVQRLRLSDPAQAGRWLLAGVIATNIAGFIFTPFGSDPSGRYFLPMLPMFAIALAELFNFFRLRRRTRRTPGRKWFGNGLALLLVAYNFWGLVQCAVTFPPGLTTQFDVVAQVDHRTLPELVSFLRAQGETRGYSNYWVSFPLAFLSEEDLIFTARLPYHQDFRYTPRDNRYAPYNDLVQASPHAAYITTNHPPLNERLRQGLTQLGVTFQETQIGNYTVFYALSRKVLPEELGLGEFCCD